MKDAAAKDLVIRVDSVDQLFNAPAADPFSDKPFIVLGEAALPYCVRQELKAGLRDWKGRRLVIQLPPGQVTPQSKARTAEALRRWAAAKRADNAAIVRISRWRSLLGLAFAIGVAGTLLLLLALALNTVLASLPATAQGLVAGLVTVFCWATVWNPWDRLIYEWVQPWLENRLLKNMATMEIVVVPDGAIDEAISAMTTPDRAAPGV